MNDTCWICEKNKANSGEHFITKWSLDFIMEKPSPGDERYFTSTIDSKSVPVKSFRNNRFKFRKNICRRCNDTISQPYDKAFNNFVENLFSRKASIINRGIINLITLVGENQIENLSIYFMKIFGCLIVHSGHSVNYDLLPSRNSILYSQANICNLYFTMHRNLSKLEAYDEKTVTQFPVIDRETAVWTVDLDWISFALTYPIPPDAQYGEPWMLGTKCVKLKLGNIS